MRYRSPCSPQRRYQRKQRRTRRLMVHCGRLSSPRLRVNRGSSSKHQAGQVLLSRDERSSDGSHGYEVIEAAWTSDSQFFVATTESNGGHQPWARPLWVYSRSKNHIFELWKFGVSATGIFTLKTPDITEVPILGCAGGGQSRILVFSLHRFLLTGRLPIAPCPGR